MCGETKVETQQIKVVHARIQEFSSGGGGGGGPGQSDKKKSSDNVFFFLSLQLFFTEVKWSISMKSIIFSRFQRGSNIFQGGPTFSRGGVQLFPIETI